jgi:hypothetical protein
MAGAILFSSLVALLAAWGQPQSQDPRRADALYPAEPPVSVVRFFTVETDELDVPKASAALGELGASLVYGPRTTDARPGHAFVALSAPAEIAAKKLGAALRKGGAAARELACIAFDGRTNTDSGISIGGFSMGTRDFVMGLSGEIAWFDSVGPWSQFYVTPGKLEPGDLVQRYEKLYAPYGGGRLGDVVRESFTWTLAAAPDEKSAKRVLSAIEKLDGVERAALEGSALTVVVELDGLLACSPAGTIPAADGAVHDEAGKAAPRAAWCTRPLHELLAREGLLASTAGK